MDLATVLGLVVALGLILFGNHLEGGHLSSLIQPTAALIVVGGTVGATMLGFPLSTFIAAVKGLKTIFLYKAPDGHKLVEEILGYAQKARRDGIIALEQDVEKASDPFLRKALTLAVDGSDSKTMREILEVVLQHKEEDGEKVAKVWEAAGGYAPTIGIIGAVMGLIHVMSNLADVNAVGAGIAVAFVATIYGVALANILFLPAANKLKLRSAEGMIAYYVMLEGALAIQEGQNPQAIKDRLESFLPHSDAKKGHAAGAPAPAAAE